MVFHFKRDLYWCSGGLNSTGKLYADRLSFRTRQFLCDPVQASKLAENGGIFIDSYQDISTLEKMADGGKFLGRGLFGFQLAMGGVEVYDAYQRGGDWRGVMAELGASVLEGFALTMLFSPAGWVVLAVAAVAEGIFVASTDHLAKHAGEYVYRHIANKKWEWF